MMYRDRAPWVVLTLLAGLLVAAVAAVAWWSAPIRAQPAAQVAAVEASAPPGAPAAAPPRPVQRKSRAVRKRAPAPVAAVAAPLVAAPTPRPEPAADERPVAVPAPVPAAVEAAPAVAAAPEPQVAQPAPEPEAPLTLVDGNGEEIARAIARAKRADVQRCFERELKRSPGLHGTVDVELDLAPPAQVNDVRVSDDLDRPALTRCIAAAMQRLSFTGLNEEITVQVPYALSTRAK